MLSLRRHLESRAPHTFPASARWKRWLWPEGLLHAQRPHLAVGLAIRKSPRIRGGLRCSREVGLPHGRLPHVRVRIDRWNDQLCARTTGSTCRRKCLNLLLDSTDCDRTRSLIFKFIECRTEVITGSQCPITRSTSCSAVSILRCGGSAEAIGHIRARVRRDTHADNLLHL